MNTHDDFWNPTALAAAENESYAWPADIRAPMGNVPDHAGEVTHVRLGGQAPMFIHSDDAEPCLVRLGGQSPMF